MSTEFERIIIEKTKSVFSTVFDLDVNAGLPYILEIPDKRHWDISGVIGLTGNNYGHFAIRMSLNLVRLMIHRARLSSFDRLNKFELLEDMLGEIINIITGNVVSEIDYEGVRLSIPVIIKGTGHEISWDRNCRLMAIPFETEAIGFEIQIGLVNPI